MLLQSMLEVHLTASSELLWSAVLSVLSRSFLLETSRTRLVVQRLILPLLLAGILLSSIERVLGTLLPRRTLFIWLPALPACYAFSPFKAFFSLHLLSPESFQGNLAHSVYKLGCLLLGIFGQVHLLYKVGMDLPDHHWALLKSIRTQCHYSSS